MFPCWPGRTKGIEDDSWNTARADMFGSLAEIEDLFRALLHGLSLCQLREWRVWQELPHTCIPHGCKMVQINTANTEVIAEKSWASQAPLARYAVKTETRGNPNISIEPLQKRYVSEADISHLKQLKEIITNTSLPLEPRVQAHAP